MEPEIGAQLGNYRLLRLIGVGGFAHVYLAQHIYLETQAAIKVLEVDAPMDQFLEEARLIAKLRHPSIVSVLEFGVEKDRPYLVMEYAANGSLRSRHPMGTVLPLSTVTSYVRQVAAALEYAHEHRVVHCDVKPENMLIGDDERILLSDFGIARVVKNTLQAQTTRDVVGTLYYMAPEQFEGKAIPASDQYALGVVLYQWLSGRNPFEGNNIAEIFYMHTRGSPPSLLEIAPAVPAAVDDVIKKALAKEPRQRFPNMASFTAAFEEAVRTKPARFAGSAPLAAPTPYSSRALPAPTVANPDALPHPRPPLPSVFPSGAVGADFPGSLAIGEPQRPESPVLPELAERNASLPTPGGPQETLLTPLMQYLPQLEDVGKDADTGLDEDLSMLSANPALPQKEADLDLPLRGTGLSLPRLIETLPPSTDAPEEPTVAFLQSPSEPLPEPMQYPPHPLPLGDSTATGVLRKLRDFLPQAESTGKSSRAAEDIFEHQSQGGVDPAQPSPFKLPPTLDGEGFPAKTITLPPLTTYLPPIELEPEQEPVQLVPERVEIFISYSHHDRKFRETLDKHLAQIKQNFPATTWHDGEIRPGVDFQQEIEKYLAKAQIILLLVSSDFIASDYCREKELEPAMERHHSGAACVIPVILRPTWWQGAPFGKLQALPQDGRPISKWKPVDDGYVSVAKGIEKVIKDMLGISLHSKIQGKQTR